MINIKLDLSLLPQNAEILSNWASIGRTIDAAIALLDTLECDDDSVDKIIDELSDLKQPLDEIHHQIRAKLWELKQP